MRVVVATDKFRGFATAAVASGGIAAGLRDRGVDAVARPVGDGGEGTAAAVHAATGGSWTGVDAVDAWGRRVAVPVLRTPAGDTLVQASDVVGLHARPDGPPARTPSSAALAGLLLAVAPLVEHRLVLCLGGTATMDGGRGVVDGLGGRLPVPRLVVAADVDIGYFAAVTTFGLQKGATAQELPELAAEVARFGAGLARASGVDLRGLAFGGAGGGIAGALACLGALPRGGFQVYAELSRFDAAVRDADVLVAGEGRVDATTWLGKAPGEVIRRAWRAGKVAALVAGTVVGDREPACAAVVTLDEVPGGTAAEACRAAGRLLADRLDDGVHR